jgi:hypothetical protein
MFIKWNDQSECKIYISTKASNERKSCNNFSNICTCKQWISYGISAKQAFRLFFFNIRNLLHFEHTFSLYNLICHFEIQISNFKRLILKYGIIFYTIHCAQNSELICKRNKYIWLFQIGVVILGMNTICPTKSTSNELTVM